MATRLMVSVEMHSPDYAAVLERQRLRYTVLKSSKRWIYQTEYLPEPVAHATAVFMQSTLLPELFLEHLDAAYEDVPEEDRLEVFKENVAVFDRDDFTRGTKEMVLPALEEHQSFSIQGWLRFRGERLFAAMVSELARAGLKSLRLQRAFHQFRELRAQPVPELVIEGRGDSLVVKDGNGVERFREYLEGYLDPRLEVAKEDLALSLVQALRPEAVKLVNVDPELRKQIEALLQG